MKNMKMLGLLAVSAMALVAFVGTASASASSFTAGEAGKSLKTVVKENHVFTITNQKVTCSVNKFEGKTEGTLSEGKIHSGTQKVHPVYEGCEAFGFKEGVSVTTTGCSYILDATSGNVTLQECTTERSGEKGILIKVSIPFTATCEVLVANQSIAAAVTYANSEGGVLVTANASSIKSNVVASTGLCPLVKGLHEGAEGGTYKGKSLVTGEGTTVEWTK